jgi:hypothetical protein
MPNMESKRYIVFLLNANKDEQWFEVCDTLSEAEDILSQARPRASGYAIFDCEKQAFTESKNYLAQDYGDE